MTQDDFTMPLQGKPFTLSRWLCGGILSAALVAGAFGGLAVLFLGDGLFDVGDDPAIPAEIQQVDARITALEERIAKLPAKPANTKQLREDVASLNEKVETLASTAATEQQNQGTAASVVLALTQIKNAYDSGQSMLPGIQLLKQSGISPALQSKLDELAQLAATQFPSKADLVAEAQNLFRPASPASATPYTGTSFTERLKGLAARFVTVQPTSAITQQTTAQSLLQALANDDLPVANNMIAQLPASPALQSLAIKIQTRLRGQKIIQELITGVTQLVQPATGKGSLY